MSIDLDKSTEPDSRSRPRMAARAGEIQRRRRAISRHRADLDPRLLAAIVATDAYWTEAQEWKQAVVAAATSEPPPEAPTSTGTTTGSNDLAAPDDPPPPGPRAWRQFRRPTFRRFTRNSVSTCDPSEDAESVPGTPAVSPELATIPGPGAIRRVRVPGRAQTWIVRTALVVAPLVLIGGAAFAVGVQQGSERIAPAASGLTDDEVQAFGLSTFPAAAAAAFGTSYVAQCLTHPDPKDRDAVAARASALSLVTSSAVPAGCGWDGTSGRAQRPSTVAWDGSATPLAGFSQGQAARVGFTAVLSNGQTLRVVVPIWSSGESFRVIGTLGLLPAAPAAAAPQPEATTEDPALASTLPAAVLTPFLKAWATSDRVQLGLLLTNDATAAATQGAAGALGSPAITEVAVTVLTGSPGAYREGDQIVALTTVTWSIGGSDQIASYTIRLRSEASRWLVNNITGATLDKSGGTARPLPPPRK